jgi:hypothetical protein
MNTASWLALAAALAAAVGSVPYAAHGLHALAPYAVAGLWALVLWADCRARARYYHRHRWEHARCHARPTRMHRVRLAARRLRTLRLRTTDTPARTA